MSEKAKNKLIQKLQATGKNVTAIIEKINNNDFNGAAIAADIAGIDFIGLKAQALTGI